MSKNKIPKMVQSHFNQIEDTLSILANSGFASITLPVKLESDFLKNEYAIVWNNSKKNEGINGGNFNLVDSYKKSLDNRTFQAMLFDNSLIRCSYNFEGDILQSHNLSWLPCPVRMTSYEESIMTAPQYVEDVLNDDIVELTNIILRTPIRFDYDARNDYPNHPKSHIHFQNSETRLSMEEPIDFNTFLKFIITNFYPESYFVNKEIVPSEVYDKLNISKWTGLSLNVGSKTKKIEYMNKNSINIDILKMG